MPWCRLHVPIGPFLGEIVNVGCGSTHVHVLKRLDVVLNLIMKLDHVTGELARKKPICLFSEKIVS